MLTFLFAWLLAFHRNQRGTFGIPDFKGIFNKLLELVQDVGTFIVNAGDILQRGVLYVISLVRDGLGSLRDVAVYVGAALGNLVRDGLAKVADVAVYVGAAIGNLLRDGLGKLGDVIVYIGSAVANLVSDGLGKVGDVAVYVGGAIGNLLRDGLGKLWDGIVWIGTTIANLVRDTFGHLADVWSFVGLGIINAITSSVGNAAERIDNVSRGIEDIDQTIVKATEGLAADVAVAVGDGLLEFVKKYVAALGTEKDFGVDVLFQVLMGIITGARHLDSSELRDFVLSEFKRGTEGLVGRGTVAPFDSPKAISDALTVATEYGLAAQLFSAVSSLIPTENATPLSYLSTFMARFSSYEPLIDASVKKSIDLALGRPYEQYVNATTQTNIPSEMAFDELLARRKIEPDLYETYHAQHGYSPFWTAHQLDAAYRPARIFELARIMQFVDLPDDTLQYMLEDAGYRDQIIDPLKVALHAVANKTSAAKLLTDATAAYSDGFIDAEGFGGIASAAGITEKEQGLLIFAAEIAYSTKVKSELLTAYRARAAADALSDEELRAGLAGIGVTGRKAEVEVMRANIARLKKPVANTAAAHKRALNATVATLTTAYKLQFRKGLIDEAQLQAQLVHIGIPDFQAAAIVELTKVEAFQVPKSVRGNTPGEVAARVQKELEAAYITQYQHDAIDAQQLAAQLDAIGIDATEADAIVVREQARKIPKPVVQKKLDPAAVEKQVRDTLARAYEEQFAKGLIGGDELEQDLIAVGIDPDVAFARRQLAEAKATKKAPPPPQPTPAP